MPKAELHVHLEGSMEPETLLELARRHGAMDLLPGGTVQALKDWFVFRDFVHFVEIYPILQLLLRGGEDLSLLTYRCGQDMARQGIRYREITFTPYVHTDVQDKGLSIEEIFEGLEDGRQRARRDFDVEMAWVFDVPRNMSFRNGGDYDPRPAELTLKQALAGRDRGVVGLGLGGYEATAPAAPFAHAFAEAREAGLLSLPHAGETDGPRSVRDAVLRLRAHRIGHGVRAIEDPELLDLLRERQIPLEVCISSNVCLAVYPDLAAHPFPELDRLGLTLTLASDDPPLFNSDLVGEYLLLARVFGYDEANLLRIARQAFLHSGAEAALRRRLLDEFDIWAAEKLPREGSADREREKV